MIDPIQLEIDALRRRISVLNKDIENLQKKAEISEDQKVRSNHWIILQKAINSNSTVKNQWDQFLMSLRLCGLDESAIDNLQ